MKSIGKKDLEHGRNIITILMVYILLLLVLVVFLISYKTHIVFWSGVIALSVLILERIVALIRFKRLPNDLVIMHRDHVEIKSSKESKFVNYKDIEDIIVTSKFNKFAIVTKLNTKIFVKYLDKANLVKKEILDYKKRYY